MKNSIFYIETEIYRILNNQISYNSIQVPIYNLEREPTESDTAFIVINTPYLISGQTKDSFITDVTIQLDVIDLQGGAERSPKRLETIVNRVLELILPNPSQTNILSNNEFKIIHSQLEASRDFTNRSGVNLVLRKVLSFTFKVKQL